MTVPTVRVVGANLYVFNKQKDAATAALSEAVSSADGGRWVILAQEASHFTPHLRTLGKVFGEPYRDRSDRGVSECKVVVGPGVKVTSHETFPLSPKVPGPPRGVADKFWPDRWATEVVTDAGVFISFHGNAVIQSKVTGLPLTNAGAKAYAKGMAVLEARVAAHVAAGREVVVAGDGNYRKRKGVPLWKWSPEATLRRAGLTDFREHRVDFQATNGQIRMWSTVQDPPGADHDWTVADIRMTTKGGDVGNADYKRANAEVQWFANAWPGSPIDPNVVVLHTTESASWPSYSGGASAPHYTAAPDWKAHRLVWRQHFPESMSSRALRNESGGVETNTLNCVQVELIGTCDPATRNAWNARGYSFIYWPTAPEWALRDLADFIADQHKRNEIRLQAPKFLAYPESYGASSVRFSGARWSNFYGICGHQHVPENTHGDPGALNIERILRYALEKAYPDKPTRLEAQRDVIEGALTELDRAPAKRRRLHDMVAAIRDALTKGPKK